MESKAQRQAVIARLVRRRRIGTQGELIRRLRNDGVAVDQSTLSRDLAELNIKKSGGSYRLHDAVSAAGETVDYGPMVQSFTTCGPHLVVLHTEVGQAQPVAVWIDHQGESCITGTLAGDDVIFIATKSRRAQAVVLRRLEQWFGEKHER